MIETLIATLGTAGAGGLTGLLGAGLKAWAQKGEAKQQRQHELETRRLDMEAARLDAALAIKRTEAQAGQAILQMEAEESIAAEQAAAAVKVESYRHDAARYGAGRLGRIADFIRALMRPLLTVYFAVVLLYFHFQLSALVEGLGALPGDVLVALYVLMVQTGLYILTTVILWWFGDRAMSKIMEPLPRA